jgi:hypothetical protein
MDWLGQAGTVAAVVGIWIVLQMIMRRLGLPT